MPATVPVAGTTTCTATVTDTGTGTPTTPQGTVTFSLENDPDGDAGTFVPVSCTLTGGSGASNSCSVTYAPTARGDGTHAIGATYAPTSAHAASSDPTPFQLTVRSRFTSTNVTCDPATVPVLGTTTCTATVSDTDAGTSTPQGTVTFSLVADEGESGAFTPVSCLLDPTATGDSNSCSVDYTPATVGDGTHEITASYTPTDGIHAASSDPTPFQLTVPTEQEEYQDHGPAQPMNVKSTEILAVTCSGDLRQASIFGLATIDGSGEFAFRIDVRDLGEPGVGQDTYRMRILAYDSGEPGTLLGGNVQIHKGP